MPITPLARLALASVLISSPALAQYVSVEVGDGNQHKVPKIFIGDKTVKRFGMLAFKWDLTVQQIRKDFENRENAGGGMTKVTWGTQVSEVTLSPAILQAMTDQMYDDLVAALRTGREVVGIEQVQQAPSYLRVGKELPVLTADKSWANPDWEVVAKGGRSLGGLATGIKMTQDDELGTALTKECGCDALIYTTIKGFVGQKGRDKVDGVPGLWLEMGSLPDTRVMVGFEQYAEAARAQGKKVLNFNKSNHVVVIEAKAKNMKLFVPGGSAKQMAGVTPEQQAAVFQKYFIDPIRAFTKEYADETAAAINAHYPK